MIKLRNIKPNDICKFAKHKGKTYSDVYCEDSSYIEWLSEKKFIVYNKEEFLNIMKKKHTNSFANNLTPEQLEVSDYIIREIRNQHNYVNYRSIAIDAESGSGKSHVLSQTIARIPAQEILDNYNIYVVGPTNHAVNLLKTKIQPVGDKINIMTLHRCLKMMKKYNDDGLIYFQPEGEYLGKISATNFDKSKINIFFVDESSMIPDRIYNYLIVINGLFIYFGDIKQLPPIEESMDFVNGVSKTLTESSTKLILSKVIRAKNENILNIHKSFRTGENMISENENVKLYHNEYDFYNAFIETLKIDNCACILTYTNKRVKEHSTNIRKLLEYSNDFDKGEFLRCNNYYDSVNVGCLDSLGMILIMDDIIDFENTEINYTNEYLTYSYNYTTHNLSERGRDYVTYGLKKFELEPMKCQTSTIVEIKKCNLVKLLFIIKSPCSNIPEKHFCIKFNILDIVNSFQITILEQSVENIEQWELLLEHWLLVLKTVFGKKIKWQLYYNIVDLDAKFTHTYSMTIHKAQGSTLKNVFVDMNDINSMEDAKMKQHLLYTAVTRSSDNVNFLI